jgi:hypothetical protein
VLCARFLIPQAAQKLKRQRLLLVLPVLKNCWLIPKLKRYIKNAIKGMVKHLQMKFSFADQIL